MGDGSDATRATADEALGDQRLRPTRATDARSTLLLLAVVAGIVLLNVFVVDGSTLGDRRLFAFELSAGGMLLPGEQWIEHWMWEQPPPHKFRILGRLPTWLTWKLAGGSEPSFFAVFATWAALWMGAATLAFRRYSKALFAELEEIYETPDWLPLASCALLLSAPPMLFAFKFPVHTEENDLLAYFLITVGMLMVVERRGWAVCAVSCLAVFCRENTLIVPLTYLLTSRDAPVKRWSVALLPVATLVAFRLVWFEPYDPFPAARHNFTRPWESYGFLFLGFGALWLPGLLGYFELRRRPEARETAWGPLVTAFPAVLFAVLATDVLLARVREIRILFVLAVFVVPFAAFWLLVNRDEIRRRLRTRAFWYGAGAAALATLSGRLFLLPRNAVDAKFLATRLELLFIGFPTGWLDILFAHLFVTLALLPIVLSYRRPEPPPAPAPAVEERG